MSGYLALPSSKKGPGIILFKDENDTKDQVKTLADIYAEEGYVVLAPKSKDPTLEELSNLIQGFRSHENIQGKVGALGYGTGGKSVYIASQNSLIDCAVFYCAATDFSKPLPSVPTLWHFVLEKEAKQAQNTFNKCNVYFYPETSYEFIHSPKGPYDHSARRLSHTRSITLFRHIMGPHYDLPKFWDAHTSYEFDSHDVDATMSTMVKEPYVNSVPTMAGGVGYEGVKYFYQNHFIFKNPKDTKTILMSRTIGIDRVVDEILFCFTHDREIDWLLPNIAPTGKYIEIAIVAVINLRGDKLYSEHIYWDQASVLVQAGLLDPKKLPVGGVEVSHKTYNKEIASNPMIST